MIALDVPRRKRPLGEVRAGIAGSVSTVNRARRNFATGSHHEIPDQKS
jgi:hypothetical protein